jgi:hypothetical protein
VAACATVKRVVHIDVAASANERELEEA